MTIRRAPRANHYTVLNTETFNLDLPPECLGVYLNLLSKPDHWNVSIAHLKKHFGCSKDKIYRIIGVLLERGLMTKVQPRKSGQFEQYEYLVTEPDPNTPYPEIQEAVPHPEKPVPVLPRPVNQSLEITEVKKILSEEISTCSKRKKYTADFESFWQIYPGHRRGDKRQAYREWKKIPDSEYPLITESVDGRNNSDPDWIKEQHKYVPNACRYLSGERWKNPWIPDNQQSNQWSEQTERSIRNIQDVQL